MLQVNYKDIRLSLFLSLLVTLNYFPFYSNVCICFCCCFYYCFCWIWTGTGVVDFDRFNFFSVFWNLIIDFRKTVLKLKIFLIDSFWTTIRVKVSRVTICRTACQSHNCWTDCKHIETLKLMETLAPNG